MLFVPPVPAMARTISREMFDINAVVKYRRLFEKLISGNTVLKKSMLRFTSSISVYID